MIISKISFDAMPQAVSQVLKEIAELKQMVLELQAKQSTQPIDRHTPMSVEEAAEYLRMPANSLYAKLAKGDIPGSKGGKRWVLYRDDLDQWVEANRKNAVPMTAEELNAATLNSHRRKPSNNLC